MFSARNKKCLLLVILFLLALIKVFNLTISVNLIMHFFYKEYIKYLKIILITRFWRFGFRLILKL